MEQFADIILPLAAKGLFTYKVPAALEGKIKPGSKVIVQFGSRKLYSGIVYDLYNETPGLDRIKPITDIIGDELPLNTNQLKLWRWISDYYMCTIGEVMKAAIPAGLRVESETQIMINPGFNNWKSLDESVMNIIKLIENQKIVWIKSLPITINGKNTIKVINSLILDNVLLTTESLKERYRPRTEAFILLARRFSDFEMNMILDSLSHAPKQKEALSAYLRLSGYKEGSQILPVKKMLLLKNTGLTAASLSSLEKKEILNTVQMEAGRLTDNWGSEYPVRNLTESQSAALNSLKQQLKVKEIALLHGITSSGKTEIYIHLIEELLRLGKQVLYLLPEIALTTQITARLIKHFGSVTGVYHSRFNDAEKVEIWRRVSDNSPENCYKLILGVRSAIFLPFHNLGLVIVDEEHDSSYKQHDPPPRYHARDSAIMLASLFGAKTILGSATPSIESYYNAISGKYGFVELKERFGNINLPAIIIANSKEAYRKKQMISHFTPELVNAIDKALSNNEQVILFRNRRGFSPYIQCSECSWIPACTQCDINLTYHKTLNKLVCHHCGYSSDLPDKCPDCGLDGIVTRGFGTEKIEDEMKLIFPAARIARMDYDTTRSRNSFTNIISAFEEKRIDILIGTQMISKGLDFENLTVVGILNVDNMLNFPDFRAHERGYQMLEQVSGRAGRRQKQGIVIIQTNDPSNRIIRLVLQHDYENMFRLQTEERKTFRYPPFIRLIKIIIRHKEKDKLDEFSKIVGDKLKSVFGKRVLGPEYPLISKIQMWYIKVILIKIERDKSITNAKIYIEEVIQKFEKSGGASSVKISVDVDPS